MRWRPEYDAISQDGMAGRMGLCSERVEMPLWFITYLATHKLEDIDPKQTTRLIAGYCSAHYEGENDGPSDEVQVLRAENQKLANWLMHPYVYTHERILAEVDADLYPYYGKATPAV